MNTPLVEVTLAILYQENRFLMQLRDDFPHIVYPGCWGFFGGHIEPGEEAEAGIRRELLEELGYVPSDMAFFQEQSDQKTRRYYYHSALAVPVNRLQLNEGQDLGLCSLAEIRAGEKYSCKLGEMRQLGKPHQQALLSFIASGLMNNLGG